MLFLGTTRVVVVRMLLGLGAFACDMGITFDFRLWSDSSAAKFVVDKVSGGVQYHVSEMCTENTLTVVL